MGSGFSSKGMGGSGRLIMSLTGGGPILMAVGSIRIMAGPGPRTGNGAGLPSIMVAGCLIPNMAGSGSLGGNGPLPGLHGALDPDGSAGLLFLQGLGLKPELPLEGRSGLTGGAL
jgi:hypothetical protein